MADAGSTATRVRTRSTGLGGQTNLAVLAALKPGMVKSYEPISYVERLRKVLAILHSARENLRESELRPSFFPDTIGRFETIHHFRYALVDPQAAGAPWRLSLNVTFDGGWEPYMRVIFRDIGPMLDLLFCHSDSYPGSDASYEAYCDWVRSHEVKEGLFFAESALTLADQRYLAAIERTQRERNGADRDFARLALPPVGAQIDDAMARAAADPIGALVLPLRTLKGLYRLSVYFPRESEVAGRRDDMTILRCFAQSVLGDAIRVMQRLDQLPAGTPAHALWQQARKPFQDELDWLAYERIAPPRTPCFEPCQPARLQSHLLGSEQEKVTHAGLVLLRVRKGQAAQALETLKGLVPECGPLPAGGVGCLVAFTYAGLQELGVHPARLERLPQEFFEGMEARHALLGDLRGNHPDRWMRPLLWGQGAGQRVALDTVHVVVQLRTELPGAGEADFGLAPQLEARVQQLAGEASGLRVLAVEPLRSYRTRDQVTGHLGVADGLSQPRVATKDALPAPPAAGTRYHDLVSTGELLLGYCNGRGDAGAGTEEMLVDGSFLVVRKLRQRMDHLHEVLRQVDRSRRDEVLAKIVGRGRDGTPLGATLGPNGANDFNYDEAAASDGCPFHSHVRRANPRDGRAYTPRILRRGMSYGPLPQVAGGAADRGVMFMAYCASIAEQFEVIQRWVAGGNSSGVGSSQADPLLRVPQQGENHVYRYLDAAGQVVRVNLGDQPLVQLQWGLYLFVPALDVLENLARFQGAPATDAAAPAPPAGESALEAMRAQLEDRQRAAAYWQQVRAEPQVYKDTAYGELVGTLDGVLEVLHDDGRHFTVHGYGGRMAESVGRNILGMDPADAGRQQQIGVRAVIEEVTQQEAFARTLAVANAVLKQFPELPRTPDDIVRRPIDLVSFSDAVLASLCDQWFGVLQQPTQEHPTSRAYMVRGGRVMDRPAVPRCPGNLASASKYIFSPHPRKEAESLGQQQGADARAAVLAWLKDPHHQPGPLAQQIRAALPGGDDATLATNIAGAMLGFAPTVQGNFLTVVGRWIAGQPSLWQLQQDLYEASPQADLTHQEARAALLRPLLDTMRQDPVPGMLWRERVAPGGAGGPPRKVVLGIGSALVHPAAPDDLLFGRDDGKTPTPHGCPGMEMGKGVLLGLLGLLGALLKAGTLRPTGSPVLLILTPNR